MNVKIADVFFIDMMESFLSPTLQDDVSIINSKVVDNNYNVIVTIKHTLKNNKYYLMPDLENGFVYGYINVIEGMFHKTTKVDFTLEQIESEFKSLTGLKLNLTLHLSTGANKRLSRNHNKKNKYWSGK